MNIAIKVPTSRVVRGVQKYEAAREAVTPYIGDPGYAFDSADAVYAHALQQMGHDTAGLADHAGAARAVFQALKGRRASTKLRIATDAKTVSARNEMFPNAGRLLNPFG
jgi:hypothetical protein